MSLFTRSIRRSFAGLSLSSSPATAAATTTASPSTLLSSSSPAGSASSSSSSRWTPLGTPPRLFSTTPTPHSGNLAPRRTKHRKSHKGRVGVPTGGSLKGSTVQQGSFGLRLLEPARLTAKQLQSAETALKRKLKPVKGAQVFLRLFPDVPVCVKGNETRMGKGKGSFSYWAVRARVGKVVFEVGGDMEMREEVAKEALRIASAKIPARTEFISKAAPPRLGREVLAAVPPGSAATVGGAARVDPLPLTSKQDEVQAEGAPVAPQEGRRGGAAGSA